MFVEVMEPRMLLSAAAVNTAIQNDRGQIRLDLEKWAADLAANTATIIADAHQIRVDAPEVPGLLTLNAKLRSDVAAMNLELSADLLKETAAVRADQAKIYADTLQYIADNGNATAQAADRTQILTDRIQLQNDDIAGLNARITTRKTWYATIGTDMDAITTAVNNDPNASPQLKADVAKFTTDRTNGMNTILADLAKIRADRTQLVTDLQALENSAPLT
jgi:hypothetical protein